jgi:hypothetical protein
MRRISSHPGIGWVQNEKKEDETEVYTDRYYGKVYRSFTLRTICGKGTLDPFRQ